MDLICYKQSHPKIHKMCLHARQMKTIGIIYTLDIVKECLGHNFHESFGIGKSLLKVGVAQIQIR